MLNRCDWSDEEIAFLKTNYNKLTNAQLLNYYANRTWLSIYKKAKKCGMYRDKGIERLNRSASKTGEKGSNWNGGKSKSKKGYVLVLKKGHHRADTRGYVMEHIAVWEEANGRQLPNGYCIHHKNGNKSDNRIENLEAMPHGFHTAMTHTGLKRSVETRNKISVARRTRFDKQNYIAG